jgi:PAS domain S-box-containing protein
MIRICLWLLSLLLPAGAAGQSPVQFHHLSANNGLRSPVTVVHQDRTGMIWIGTTSGLVRYDGYEMRMYRRDAFDSTSLPSNRIHDIAEDPEGMLWLGTGRGLVRFDPRTETPERIPLIPAKDSLRDSVIVSQVYVDSLGRIWAGTGEFSLEGYGVFVYDPTRKTTFQLTETSGLGGNTIFALQGDRSGNVWVGTENGLSRIRLSDLAITTLRHESSSASSLSDSFIMSIFADSRDNLWIGTYRGGMNLLLRRDLDSPVFTRFQPDRGDPRSFPSPRAFAFSEDGAGRIWIGTLHGLAVTERDRPQIAGFTSFRHEDDNPASLTSDIVYSLFTDRSGLVWIGTVQGVDLYSPYRNRFVSYLGDPKGNADPLRARIAEIRRTGDHRFWLATDRGLFLFDPASGKTEKPFGGNLRLPFHRILDVAEIDGEVWIATTRGLFLYDLQSKQLSHFLTRDSVGLHSDYIGNILIDRHRRIWLSTTVGLHRVRRTPAVRFDVLLNDRANPGSQLILDVAEDHDGVIWAATINGLYSLSGDLELPTLRRYEHDRQNDAGLSDNEVGELFVDRQNRVWMATASGLDVLSADRTTFGHYSSKNGLGVNVVSSITEDLRGDLWCGTDNGILRLDPRTQRFISYDADDGLPAGEWSASITADDGRIFFGGRGLTSIRPERTTFNLVPPPVAVTRIFVLEKERKPPDPQRLELSHRDYVVSFEFSAFDFTNPSKNMYAFKLEGFDRDWIYSGTQRRATYTNLAGGRYTFRVKASNHDGIWNDAGTSIDLIVHPPFWQTWWFRGLLVLSIGLSVFAVHRLRLRAVRHRQVVLEAEVTRRSERLHDANRQLSLEVTERRRMENALKAMAEGTAMREANFFHLLVDRLAEALHVPMAFVAECTRDQSAATIIAFHGDVDVPDGYTYDVEDAPCKVALTDGEAFFKERVRELFPRHVHLNALSVEGYLGIGLRNSEGVIIGHLAVMDTSPMVNRTSLLPILRIFASRAAGELERKHIENEQERLVQILESTTDLVAMTDPEGRMLYVNRAGLKILGFSADAFAAGVNLATLYSETAAAELRSRFAHMVSGPMDSCHFETTILRHGSPVPVSQVLVAHRDSRGAAEFFSTIIRDISEQKAIQLELSEARDSAEVASRAKSDFLAHMSHELRTPLNGILGYAQILKKDPTLAEPHRDGIAIIEKCGDHLLSLINDILDLSKIEAGRMELYEDDFSLTHLMEHVSGLIRVRCEDKGLSFIMETIDAVPDYLRGDEKKIRQVLLNILSNAVKFTDNGGVVFQVGLRGDRLRFRVEDTGVGIPADHIDDIFQPFRQVHQRLHHVEGTGLGLAISKRLVDVMGGQLTIEGAVGKGTVCTIDLPLTAAEAKPAVTAAPRRRISGYTGPRRRILIVDDKGQNRTVLTSMLEPLGFELIEAANGQECLDRLSFQPDLILMDLRMPVMDGLEATRRIRATGQDVAIIAITASAFEQNQTESISAGCNGYLSKPFREADLLRMLEKHLHLEWILEPSEDSTNLSPGVLPRGERLDEVCELARIGDIQGLIDALQLIKSDDPSLEKFCNDLLHLARGFQISRIREYLSALSPTSVGSMSAVSK